MPSSRFRLFLILIPLISFSTFAQIGSVTLQELSMTAYEKDSSAGAVILSDMGELDCSGENAEFTCYQKIKIFKKDFFDLATQSIHLKGDQDVFKVEGACHVWENGKKMSYPLTKELVHKIEEGDERHIQFSIPNLKEGAVIEFRYTIISEHTIYLPHWSFQSRVPVKKSELKFKSVKIDFGYEIQGFYPLSVSTKDVEQGDYCWAINDLPAFEDEEYVIRPEEYNSAIQFYVHPPRNIEEGWREMIKGVKNKDSFMRPDVDFLLPHLESIKQKSKDSLSLMAACYDFIKDNVKFKEGENNINCRPMKRVFAEKSGNAAEINLMLCYLLREAGFVADPIITSTRAFGRISPNSYPSKYNFNYMVTITKINGTTYYLDATDDLRPYSFPSSSILECEGAALQKKDLTWVKLVPTATYSDAWVMDMQLDEAGVYMGKAICVKKGYSALEARKEIRESGIDAYKRKIRKMFGLLEVMDIRLENIEDINKNLMIYFNVQLEDTLAGGKILLTPILVRSFESNPFKLKERTFPIDFVFPVDFSYRINIKYPVSYKVQSIPANAAFITKDNSMSYKYIQTVSDFNLLTIFDKFQSKNCYYDPILYPSIKELIGKMVEKQKEDLIFSK
jgi:hypothetical protein